MSDSLTRRRPSGKDHAPSAVVLSDLSEDRSRHRSDADRQAAIEAHRLRIAAARCPACKGRGRVRVELRRESCKACAGTGERV